MKKYFLIFLLFLSQIVSAQKVYKSTNGWRINPRGTYRSLNIFINIVYDQTPEKDPSKNSQKEDWQIGKLGEINVNPPKKLINFIDTNYTCLDSVKSGITRLYAESSLEQFILLGDFISVDVAQSAITPKRKGRSFSWYGALKIALETINKNGGLKTIFGYENIEEYDRNKDRKIDILQIIFRNSIKTKDYYYGSFTGGQGQTGKLGRNLKIKVKDSLYTFDIYTAQGSGGYATSETPNGILTHEFSHNFFGSNAAHSSGGNHYGGGQVSTFMGVEAGYGLMGSYNISLTSCNAYERWRVGWLSKKYNPKQYPIAANEEFSDIEKKNGNKIFTLRDFVTTGDAVRIRLPYRSPKSPVQFIWLENHQVGKNNKIDHLYHNYNKCRSDGKAGIYAYLQIGKDKREGSLNEVFPYYEADHLKMMSADGYWDYKNRGDTTFYCVKWPPTGMCNQEYLPNPFCGDHDQSTHFFNDTSDILLLKHGKFAEVVIREDGTYQDNLVYLGDTSDAFSGRQTIKISTNPASVNSTTFYMKKSGKNIQPYNKEKNEKKIFLTGLRIDLQEKENGTFDVKITWDDYTIDKNVRWTGDIILKEKLEILEKKEVLISQNLTPCLIKRDTISKQFAPTSVFTCENGSELILRRKSKLILDEKSKLIIEPNAKLIVEKGAKIILKNGSEIIGLTKENSIIKGKIKK